MPSLKHAALVEMFRMHPELIPRLLRDVFHLVIPAYATLAVSDTTLDQVAPTEFHADLVVELFDATGKVPIFSTIVEVQLGIDDDKQYSWPAYMILKRAKQRCETCVLVVAPDPQVAAWARKPIRIGPGNELRVLVLGPAEIPAITDLEVAVGNPEMAVLSALAHGNEPEHGLPVLRVALGALAELDSQESRIYLHLIFKAVAGPLARALRKEAMLRDQSTETEAETELDPEIWAAFERFRERVALGKAQGRAEGKAEGIAEGKAEGETQGEARMLLKILDRQGFELTAEQRHTIETCRDRVQLDRWADRAFVVKTAAELFA